MGILCCRHRLVRHRVTRVSVLSSQRLHCTASRTLMSQMCPTQTFHNFCFSSSFSIVLCRTINSFIVRLFQIVFFYFLHKNDKRVRCLYPPYLDLPIENSRCRNATINQSKFICCNNIIIYIQSNNKQRQTTRKAKRLNELAAK